jgi:hypothetical protein
VILSRTVVVPEPLVRANVVEALSGPGAPAGEVSCSIAGATIVVTFDAGRSAPELIDALIEVASRFVPARSEVPLDRTAAIAGAARGLAEPDLGASRIIETYLP